MSRWKECKLGDVAEITSSKRIYYSEYVANGVPFFRSKEIIERFNRQNTSTELFIRRERFEEIRLKFGAPQEGDMLLTSVGTLGIPYLVQKEDEFYFKDGNLTWFRNIDPKVIDKYYLYFYITSDVGQQKLYEASIGSTQPALTIIGLKNIDIFLPPLPEQRAIAGVLSSLDDKIDLLHRQNKTLEDMAETLFRQWFVEEETNRVKLGDIIEIFDNKRVPLSSMQRDKMKEGTLYPYYGAATIMDYINQYIFDGEYLLLGEDGTVQTNEGFPILQLATGKYWVNNHTHVLKAKKPFTNFLLYTILKRTSVSHIVTGAVQPKINQENLKSLELQVVNENRIAATAKSTNILWQKIQNNKSQIHTLEKLRDTLLPKLMSGDVRVELEELKT